MNVPAYKLDGCLAQLPADVRAAMLHQGAAIRASAYVALAGDADHRPELRRFYRRMARVHASAARAHFAQWQEARR